MRVKFWRMAAAGAGVSTLLLTSVVALPGAASAATVVPFSSASFHGYASGDEVHLGALGGITGSDLADVDEAYSGSTTDTSGLASAISDPEISTNTIQPAQTSSIKSYGQGSPLAVALEGSNVATLYGQASSTAPPSGAQVSKSISLPAELSPLLSANALTSAASTFYDPDACPLGQPLSYGYGSLADATVLPLTGTLTTPVVTTPSASGDPNGVANSASLDYLSPNGDGTFGLSSSVEETVAPVSINLLDLAQIGVAVQGASPTSPITLTADATGGGSGASVKLTNADAVNITLTAAGQTTTVATVPVSDFGPAGVTVDIGTGILTGATSLVDDLNSIVGGVLPSTPLPAALQAILSPVTKVVTQVTAEVQSAAQSLLTAIDTNISLGSIDVGVLSTSSTGGTAASGTFDLAKVNLSLDGTTLGGVSLPSGLTSIDFANAELGHMAVAATSTSPITCSIPMEKTSDPTAVTAGARFTSNILVPDPTDGLACSLSDLDVTDTITDYQGSPTFTVTSATNGGTVKTVSPNEAVVTWTGLSWTAGGPPLDLQVELSVPSTSPAGVIQDTATSKATTSGCTGGASGVTGLDSGLALTGTAHLTQPSVAAVRTAAAGKSAPAATTLPFTGAMGGLWQPFAGIGMLVAGVGTLTLLRRARRMQQG